MQRTMAATGASKPSICKIQKGIKTPKKTGPKRLRIQETVDEHDRGAIRRMIQSMYADKTWPTIAKMYDRVKNELGFQGSQTTFTRILKNMGFTYKKRQSAARNILKERPDIVAKRQDFILKMRAIRLTGRKLVYLDETWLNATHAPGKCWLDDDGNGGIKVPSGKGSRLIILHAGTEDGFVPNGLLCFQSKQGKADYHDEMDGDRFYNWFHDQLLPNIPEKSVILMDNASYHSVRREKAPILSSKKAEMQKWLVDHNIQFDQKMIKVQLYEIIKQNKERFPTYVIDELAKEHGHTVVRVPPYHCEFNAEELIWAQIKGGVARRNQKFTISHVKTLLEDQISRVTPANWRNAIDHVRKLEQFVFDEELKIDSILSEHELASFRFYPYESDSESDSSDDDNDEWPDDSDDDPQIWIPQQEAIFSESSDDEMDEDDVPEFPAFSTARTAEV